jgi:hypothetical protein
MNIKPVLRYQLHEYFRAFSTTYEIVYILIIGTIILRYVKPTDTGSASGIEFATMVTIFIVGLALFKSAFRFFSSYGVSRKRLFFGLTAAMGVTAAATSLLDMVNAAIFSRFVPYSTLYAGLLQNRQQSDHADLLMAEFRLPYHEITLSLLARNFLWCLLSYFALGMLGFLIAALYYRMGTTQKILVSVGVPAVFFILIPLLDHNVTGGRIDAALSNFWTHWTLWGLNPGSDLATRLLLIAMLAGCVWLLLRRAEVKA